MRDNTYLLVGIVAIALAALAGFLFYRRQQRERNRQVVAWVKHYLVGRYGHLPDSLHINCSDDRLWPVLVTFDAPRGGSRHHLQFHCGGDPSTFVLASAVEEKREQTAERAGPSPPHAVLPGGV